MLAADKDRLIASAKQTALQLRHKELDYYIERYSNLATQASILAGFAFDDDGTPAERRMLIERGVLLHPLGGSLSQARARAAGHDVGGVATTRACSWRRWHSTRATPPARAAGWRN